MSDKMKEPGGSRKIEKSRRNVLAEREAKKLAKAAKKQKENAPKPNIATGSQEVVKCEKPHINENGGSISKLEDISVAEKNGKDAANVKTSKEINYEPGGNGNLQKDREDVVAEREAKKLANAAAKKGKGPSQSTPKPILVSGCREEMKYEKDATEKDGVQPIENRRPEVPTAAANGPENGKEAANVKTSKEINYEPSGNRNPQKSREDVVAEREAKKLAKAAAKKGKGTSQSTPKPILVSGCQEEMKYEKDATKNDSVQPIENRRPEVTTAAAAANGPETVEKSKAQLRAERRAKQDAQRAKKAEETSNVPKKGADSGSSKNEKDEVTKTTSAVSSTSYELPHGLKLFAHLFVRPDFRMTLLDDDSYDMVALYRSRVICGSNVRCLALLKTLKKVIASYTPSTTEDVGRGLDKVLANIQNVIHYRERPVAVSMVNAMKQIRQKARDAVGDHVKEELRDWIDTYIKEQLEKAAEAISISVRRKITDGDVILTYGCSSLIEKILVAAHKAGIEFRVVVVDGRPFTEGREMLRRLLLARIHCTYILVNAISFVMPEVTMILLGAHALLANGYVMSRTGSSQVALMGKAMNVPVLVCCETHKFSERVQTDSIVYNEIVDPSHMLKNWYNLQVTPLIPMYDVTPPELVSAVVTELAILPCTSVPVILRIK